MSIPLIQEATKDAINTSIIAIKRNIERINMLLGLVDSGSPDLSGLATKQELEDAVNSLQPVDEVALNNMQSVTSNAVAECLRYTTTERIVGYWVDGRPIYRKVFKFTAQNNQTTFYNLPYTDNIIRAYLCVPENPYVSCSPYVNSDKTRGQSDYRVRCTWCNDTNWYSSLGFIYFEHTKASDLV